MTEQLLDLRKLLEKIIERGSSRRFYDGQVFYDQIKYRKKNWLKREGNND